MKLGNEPVLLESPGHVGVLLIPARETPTQYKVSLRELPLWGGDAVDRYANSVISEVLSKVTQAQVLLGQHKPEQALEIVQELRAKHPKLSYLGFLESSCYLVMGQREKATATLSRSLEDFPKDEQAKALYRSIAGEKRP
jgi:predicted Zn-dependent protease